MGLIRVSDHAEKLIREHSHGRTITATVDAILAGSVAPDGTEMWKGQPATDDDLRDYLDKKFDELKTLIENTTVDRVAGLKVVSPGTSKVYVPWDVARELFYEFLDEKSTEWRPNVYNILQDTDETLNCYIQDGYICVDDHYGKQHLLVQVSPRVEEFLKKVEPSI